MLQTEALHGEVWWWNSRYGDLTGYDGIKTRFAPWYPLVMTNITMKNHHRSSEFSHEKWWFSIVSKRLPERMSWFLTFSHNMSHNLSREISHDPLWLFTMVIQNHHFKRGKSFMNSNVFAAGSWKLTRRRGCSPTICTMWGPQTYVMFVGL